MRAMELDDAELRELSLAGAGWLLLECPLGATLRPGFIDVARSLAQRGHRLLLAHPERCPIFLRSPEVLDELVAEGMLVQVTAGALSGQYGRIVLTWHCGSWSAARRTWWPQTATAGAVRRGSPASSDALASTRR
jgi:hypothetical protein